MAIAPSLRSRLEKLEAVLAPAVRVFVCFVAEGQPPAEQLAAFRAANRVAANDILVTVEFTFA